MFLDISDDDSSETSQNKSVDRTANRRGETTSNTTTIQDELGVPDSDIEYNGAGGRT